MTPDMCPDLLACPESRLPVREVGVDEAKQLVAPGESLVPRVFGPLPTGPTPTVLIREDQKCVYPVLDGIPILLAPEVLLPSTRQRSFNLNDARYAEAYAEMEFYNRTAEARTQDVADSDLIQLLAPVRALPEKDRNSFPEPPQAWLDAKYDLGSQWDAYKHIGSVQGERVLQVGGSGLHALKFLYAGAREAWLLSPMVGELRFAQSVAERCGLASRFHCVAGIAEELPFKDEVFDAVYSGGCVHHMVTELALPEFARVLRDRGRFAAMDPWRAPLYGIGVRVFGQREAPLVGRRDIGVHCRPLTETRTRSLFTAFPQAAIERHGALTRYPLLALAKLGWEPKFDTAWRMSRMDDAICARSSRLRRMGSSVALLGTQLRSRNNDPTVRRSRRTEQAASTSR